MIKIQILPVQIALESLNQLLDRFESLVKSSLPPPLPPGVDPDYNADVVLRWYEFLSRFVSMYSQEYCVKEGILDDIYEATPPGESFDDLQLYLQSYLQLAINLHIQNSAKIVKYEH